MTVSSLRRRSFVNHRLGWKNWRRGFFEERIEQRGGEAVIVDGRVAEIFRHLFSMRAQRHPHEISIRLRQLLSLGPWERDYLESVESVSVAQRIAECLPRDERSATALLEQGFALCQQMSWERVVVDQLLPALDKVLQNMMPASAILSGAKNL